MEKIREVDYEEEMGQDYVDYAMSVITERALPDVKDGLKPVQRRILYSLSELTRPDAPHRKCARIVGDCMGKYHPHGDSSIYEGLVNLAQNWKLPIPLVDPHGNFGDVSGSGAAAMRYTEARISQYAEEGMKDLKYCDFVPNFDGTEKEPVHIPFLIPNLLTSGATGIAVGMATNIPTHNLCEVADAEIAYLENPDVTTDELLNLLEGPDFATGGIINTTPENLKEIYETGSGKIKVRGKVEIRDIGRGRRSICVTEIPFPMIGSTEKFLNTVADLARQGQLPQVVDIADRGDKDGECLAIDVKKGTSDEDIEKILNILYKKAGLEESYSVNMNCIYNGKPEVMGLRRILACYTEYKQEVYQAKYRKLKEEQETEREVKAGLLQAVDAIDLIIEILRGARSVKDAKACLMEGKTEAIHFRFKGSEEEAKALHFTEKQTDAILSMRLQKLIGLEVDVLKAELDEAEKKVARYTKLLESDRAMKKQMISDIEALKKKYGIPRRTRIQNLGEVMVQKEREVPTEQVVLLDRFYYLKAAPLSIFEKNQDKSYRFAVKCLSTDKMAVFDSQGTEHVIRVKDIMKRQTRKDKKFRMSDKGIQIFEFCAMQEDSDVVGMIPISDQNPPEGNLVLITRDGRAKRTSLDTFYVTRKTSTAMKAELAFAGKEKDYILAETKEGYAIKVRSEEVPVQGKSAAGVTLIQLKDKDEVIRGDSLNQGDSFDGIPLSDMKAVKRGGRGNRKKQTE